MKRVDDKLVSENPSDEGFLHALAGYACHSPYVTGSDESAHWRAGHALGAEVRKAVREFEAQLTINVLKQT